MSSKTNLIPVRTNRLLFWLFVLLGMSVYFLIPQAAQYHPSALLMLIPIALLTNSFWSVIHESFHHSLSPDRDENERMGRALCWFYGAPWRLLRFGHLAHHRFNRSVIDRPDIFDPGTASPARARLGYYLRLLGGLYLLELAAAVVFLLPQKLIAAFIRYRYPNTDRDLPPAFISSLDHALLNPHSLLEIRFDAVIALALLLQSAWLYGSYLWALLLFLTIRGALISFADNLPHYGTSLYDAHFGRNLETYGFVSRLLLHFNLHGIHHQFPALPWSELPRHFGESGRPYDAQLWQAAMAQLRGPIAVWRAGGSLAELRCVQPAGRRRSL